MKEKENFELAAKIIFFGTLEESFAIEGAKKLAKIENKELLLEAVHKLLLRRKDKMATMVHLTDGSFVFPAGVDLSYWREFKTNCHRDAFLAVLYKWIGEISDEDLCQALQISKGSLYSRYNEGLRELGALLVNSQTAVNI
ncbi:MAG: hypothetical protein ACRBBP_03590 [Bdellovibrionales bacterium]